MNATAKMMPLDSLREHPRAGLVPEMRANELAELEADIRARGVQLPVHVVEADGLWQILDGRHRFRCARAAGLHEIPVFVVELGGEGPVEYMLRQALLRRQLTDDQRAALAVELQKQLRQQAVTERAQRGGQASARGRAGESLSGRLPDKLEEDEEPWLFQPESDAPEVDPGAPLEQSFAARMGQAGTADEGRRIIREHETAINALEVALGLEPSVGQQPGGGSRGFSTLTAVERRAMVKRAIRADAAVGERLRALVEDGLAMEPPWKALLTAEYESRHGGPVKRDSRREAAVAVGLPPESRKLRDAAKLDKQAPELLEKVKSGEMSLRAARREVSQIETQQLAELATSVRETDELLAPTVLSLDELGQEEPFDLVLYSPLGWSTLEDKVASAIKPHLHANSQLLLFGGVGVVHVMDAQKWCVKLGMEPVGEIYWHNPRGWDNCPLDGYPRDMSLILWAVGPGPEKGTWDIKDINWGGERRTSLISGHGHEHLPRVPQWLLRKMLERHASPGDRVLVLWDNHGVLACQLVRNPMTRPRVDSPTEPPPKPDILSEYREKTQKHRAEVLAACERILSEQTVTNKQRLIQLVASALREVQEPVRHWIEGLERDGRLVKESSRSPFRVVVVA